MLANRRDQQHVRRLAVEVEELAHVFQQTGRGERPERLPELDLEVHQRLHLGTARVTQDAAGA